MIEKICWSIAIIEWKPKILILGFLDKENLFKKLEKKLVRKSLFKTKFTVKSLCRFLFIFHSYC